MEKYSKWRDPATGIAPLVVPLPTSTQQINPAITILATPISYTTGALRFALVLVGLGLHWLVTDALLAPLAILGPVVQPIRAFLTVLFTRFSLALLGFLWIESETVSLKRSTKLPTVAFAPGKGDLLVANSSSYVDLLYLAFRYNPTFVLPVARLKNNTPEKITGWRRGSLLQAVLASGGLPERRDDGESLDDCLKKAHGPVALFPECTTSNNRGLLKFADLAPNAAGKSSQVKVFIVAFKYATPTHLSPSATLPIPPFFSHLWSLCTSLTPRSLSVRKLHPSESPRLSSQPKQAEWDALADALAGAGRLKRTGIDWVAKGAFLQFREGKK